MAKQVLLTQAIFVLLDAVDTKWSGKKELNLPSVRCWLKHFDIPHQQSSDDEDFVLGDEIELFVEKSNIYHVKSRDFAFSLARYCFDPLFADDKEKADYRVYRCTVSDEMEFWMRKFSAAARHTAPS